MKVKSKLKPYRVSIAVDVVATDREAASSLAQKLCDLLHGRWWVGEVLLDGIEERAFISKEQP